ncbi:hypothetical protein B0H14DRAFT_3128793 [Mycena olivaceomarginata]|nr:hypothetical protein B0H14DRAFT_3128793 [Mycena olivaceomarginata]
MALANALSDFDLLYRQHRNSAPASSIKLEKSPSGAGSTWPCRDTQTRRHPLVNLTIALHEKPSARRLSCLTTRVRADTSGTACHRAGKREGCRSASSPATGTAGCFITVSETRRPSFNVQTILLACLFVLAKAELTAPAKPRRTSAFNGYGISVYHISPKIGMRGTFTAFKTRIAEFRGKNATGPRGN